MALAMLGALATGGPASAASKCIEPEPTLTYTAEEMFIELAVNYHGCGWWHGKTIELMAGLTQGPVIESGFDVFMGCSSFAERKGKIKEVPTYECDINVGLGHLPAEAATYSAYFEYPWKGGTERIEFEFVCVSAVAVAECQEQ